MVSLVGVPGAPDRDWGGGEDHDWGGPPEDIPPLNWPSEDASRRRCCD